jgi:hypothetical protein
MGRGFVALSAQDKKCPVSYPAGRQRRWTTYGKPHTWTCLVLRGRKSGYTPVRDDNSVGEWAALSCEVIVSYQKSAHAPMGGGVQQGRITSWRTRWLQPQHECGSSSWSHATFRDFKALAVEVLNPFTSKT